MQQLQFRRGIVQFLVVCLSLLAAPLALGGEDYDLYYRVFMDKAEAGWLHSVQNTEGDRITTTREMQFRFKRGDAESSASMTTVFVETAAGKPVSMRSSQQIGAKPLIVEYTFEGVEVEVVSDPHDARAVSRVPAPAGAWLTPAAANQFMRQRLGAGARQITYQTVDPLSGPGLVTITHTRIEKGSIQVGERTIEGYSMKSTASNAPGVSGDDFLDLNGRLVKQLTGMGGILVSLLAAGPEIVNESPEAPEMMISTLVTPDRAITDPRRASKGVFTLDYVDGEAPAPPETGSQTTTALAGTKVTISVDASMPNDAPAADVANKAYRESSAIVTSSDKRIQTLSAEAVKGIPEGDVMERARALHLAAGAHISNKNLDVGFAAAAEVAQTRSGDCSEHAVLLAAMLRAQGIPSRIAGGLLYVDEFAGKEGIFGYHMWAQALVEIDGSPRWVDLDATLPENPGYDATHITLIISSLSDADGSNEMMGIATAMGRIKISVVEIEHRK